MKYLLAAAVVAAGMVASFSSANAAGGCGPGFHRGPYGGCRPNGRVVVVRPAPRVVVAPRVCPRGFVWRYGRCRPY
ncbi:GCG_CRPN prefix-to-repeats domain-containing protein [Bradyrhizobium cenepequi]